MCYVKYMRSLKIFKMFKSIETKGSQELEGKEDGTVVEEVPSYMHESMKNF